jgi:hypothetical protein
MRLFLILFACLAILLGCSPSVPPHDPLAVVKAEIAAVNAGHTDTAASLFADDAQIVTGFGQPSGKEKIHSFLYNLIKLKEHDDIVLLTSDGANVTGNLKIWNQNVGNNEADIQSKASLDVTLKAVVQDGKIVSWEMGSPAK